MLQSVSPRTLAANTVSNSRRQLSALAKLTQQLSSGLRVERPSDDPLAIRQILSRKAELSRGETRLGNVDAVRTKLNDSVSQLLSAKDLLVRAHELAADARQTDVPEVIAGEVDELFKRLLDIANESQEGEYLFGGAEAAQQPFVEGPDGRVVYQGSPYRSRATVGSRVPFDVRFSGAEIFQQRDRGTTLVFGGHTGAQAAAGTDNAIGAGTLVVRHTGTSYAAGGVSPGASSVAGDTILGPAGAHVLHLEDLSGTGASGTVSLDGGAAVAFTNADTDLQVTGPDGQVVHLDLSAITAGFVGDIPITADGALSVDEGATETPIDFSSSQRLIDSRTGLVTGIDSSAIRRAGVEQLEYPGTEDAFSVLQGLAADLRNSRGLSPQDWQDAITRRIGDLDRVRDDILGVVGQQSLALETLDGIQFRLEDRNLQTEIDIGNLEDVDVAEAATQLATYQNMLQATYAASSRLLNLSLLDYLG